MKNKLSNIELIEKSKLRKPECNKNLQELNMRRESRWKDSKENKELNKSDLTKKPLELNMKRDLRWKDSKENRDSRK